MADAAPAPSAPLDSPLPPPSPRRRAGALIFLIVFLDLLGVGLIVPLGPYIIEQYSASGTAVAMLTLSYSAAQFLAMPVLGSLSDRFGRRPVLIASLFGSAIGYVIFAGANSLTLLFASRALDGVTGGNISTAQAYLADITPPESRGKAYGLVGAAFGLGFTLGPALSGVLTKVSLMAPVWAAAGLSLVTCLLVALFLPESLAPALRRKGRLTAAELNPVRVLLSVLRVKVLAPLIGAVFLMGLAHAELRTSFGIMLRDTFRFTEEHTSWMFAYMGLLAVLVQGGLVRRLSPALGDRRTAVIGLPVGVLGYALMPAGSSWQLVAGALALLAIGTGLAGPTITSMLSGRVDAAGQGTALGASQAASALALVIGPIIAGQLYDHVGRGWPFWTGAVFLVFALLIIATLTEHVPKAHLDR